MSAPQHLDGYRYSTARETEATGYILPAVMKLLTVHGHAPGTRIFELGCGNGAVAARLQRSGYQVTGVDPSKEGITIARETHPTLELHQGSCYDALADTYGRFPVVLSLEVIEHVFLPRDFARAVGALLEPQGIAIVSTPYHGYLKNLVLAISGRLDSHFTALWDYGHIKFWSRRTLTRLFAEVGLDVVDFVRVGRIPPVAKSMVVVLKAR